MGIILNNLLSFVGNNTNNVSKMTNDFLIYEI